MSRLQEKVEAMRHRRQLAEVLRRIAAANIADEVTVDEALGKRWPPESVWRSLIRHESLASSLSPDAARLREAWFVSVVEGAIVDGWCQLSLGGTWWSGDVWIRLKLRDGGRSLYYLWLEGCREMVLLDSRSQRAIGVFEEEAHDEAHVARLGEGPE